MARKLLSTVAVVAIFGAVAGSSTSAAFTGTTTNSGNSLAAGSVTIGDNDAGQTLYSLSDQRPGVTTSRCIKVTYSGSLASGLALAPAPSASVLPGREPPPWSSSWRARAGRSTSSARCGAGSWPMG